MQLLIDAEDLRENSIDNDSDIDYKWCCMTKLYILWLKHAQFTKFGSPETAWYVVWGDHTDTHVCFTRPQELVAKHQSVWVWRYLVKSIGSYQQEKIDKITQYE